MKEEHYIVAGHVFCLRMAENDVLWQCLKNVYGPFRIKTTDCQSLFILTVYDYFSNIETVSSTKNLLLEQIGCDGTLFRYYQFPDYCRFEYYSSKGELDGVMCVDTDFHKADLYICPTPVRRKQIADSGLMLMYILNAICFDTFVMHASVILCEGKGYLLMGKSGTGKSTHCELWRKYILGSERLNDDHPVVRLVDDIPTVYGSPWSGKTPCYRNLFVPIGGFIRLRQSSQNQIFSLSPLEAYASLSASCAAMTWEPDHADAKDRMIQQLISKIPCWRLDCLPDEAAARLCAETVRKEVHNV